MKTPWWVLYAVVAIVIALLGIAHLAAHPGGAPVSANTLSTSSGAPSDFGWDGTPTPVPFDPQCLMWQPLGVVAEPPLDGSPLEIYSRPKVASDSFGNAHVVWDNSHSLSHKVGYTWFDARTSQWQPATGVDQPPSEPGGYADPDITLDGQGVAHVVWERLSSWSQDSLWSIVYSRRALRDDEWRPREFLIADSHSHNRHPALIADGDRLHLVWEAGREPVGDKAAWSAIRYMVSPDQGATWSPVITVTSQLSVTHHRPTVAAGLDGSVHTMWHDTGNRIHHTVYSQMDPETEMWSAPQVVFPNNGAHYNTLPGLVVDAAGGVHAVTGGWGSEQEDHIYYAYRSPDTEQWTEPHALELSTADSYVLGPAIALDPSGAVHVVWVANGGLLKYTCKPANRAEWSVPRAIVVSDDVHGSPSWPVLAANSNGALVAVWADWLSIHAAVGEPVTGRLYLPVLTRK